MPLFVFDGLDLNHAIDESQLFLLLSLSFNILVPFDCYSLNNKKFKYFQTVGCII